MKFGQSIEFNKSHIFLDAQNESGRLVPDPFLFFEKAL